MRWSDPRERRERIQGERNYGEGIAATCVLRLPYTVLIPVPTVVIAATATSEMKPASSAYSIKSCPLSSYTKLFRSSFICLSPLDEAGPPSFVLE